MRRRLVELLVFGAIAAVVIGWSLPGRDQATGPAARQESTTSGTPDADAAVRREIESQAIEYAQTFIVPETERPETAKIGDVHIELKGRHDLDGVVVERWELTGLIESRDARNMPVRIPWQLVVAIKDRRFAVLRCALNGKPLVVHNR